MTMFDALRRVFSIHNKPSTSTQTAVAIEHAFLGVLTPDMDVPSVLVGRTAYENRLIDIRLSDDGASTHEVLALAESAVRSLKNIDLRARLLLANDCLDGYNSDWRFGETLPEDSSTKVFEKPMLSREEFCAKVQLETVEICGSSTITLWYSDDDMFWGHDLFVTSFDGLNLMDTHVSMAG
jgi:hypothetical protein